MAHWRYTIYPLALLIAAALSVLLALLAWRRRPLVGATPSSLMMLSAFVWSLGYALQLRSPDSATALFWAKYEHLGIVSAPVAWACFALAYSRRDRWITPRNIVLLSLVPVATLVLVWTNHSHGLMWREIARTTDGWLSTLRYDYGPWFWVHTAYSYLLMLAGSILVCQMLVQSQGPYRGQVGALLVGALGPWVGNAVYLLWAQPRLHVDITPFVFAVSGAALMWGTLRFRLLDVMPVARQTVIEKMRDGVIVLDGRGRVLDLNPAARQVLGVDSAAAIGQPIAELWAPGCVRLTGDERDLARVGNEIVLGEGCEQKWIELRTSPLESAGSSTECRLMTLHDITAQKHAERERERLIADLERLVANNKALRGLLPICSRCKKIRDGLGCWRALETYIIEHSQADFTYGICPECMGDLYPGFGPEALAPDHDGQEIHSKVLR